MITYKLKKVTSFNYHPSNATNCRRSPSNMNSVIQNLLKLHSRKSLFVPFSMINAGKNVTNASKEHSSQRRLSTFDVISAYDMRICVSNSLKIQVCKVGRTLEVRTISWQPNIVENILPLLEFTIVVLKPGIRCALDCLQGLDIFISPSNKMKTDYIYIR